MLFCDSFSVLEPTDAFPPYGRLGLSLWEVAGAPVRNTLTSMPAKALQNCGILEQSTVFALFSFVKQDDVPSEDGPVIEFPIGQFKSQFEEAGFLHPISLSQNQGFCFILIGKHASKIARCRCICLQKIFMNRPIKAGFVFNCPPLFELFPSIAQASIRFPVAAPPHERPSFFSNERGILIHSHRGKKKTLEWGKAVKVNKWRNHLTEIIPGVFIGSSVVASNSDLLKSYGITHLVNCASQVMSSTPGFETLEIPMNDGGDENILSHIWSTSLYIQKCLDARGKCLIHCVEGVSRSVAVFIGYLMLSTGLDYLSSFGLTRRQRRVASPNPRFIAQLMQLAEIVGRSSTRTCFFSKAKLLPFEVIKRRSQIVAVPMYEGVPDFTEDRCFVVVDFRGADCLLGEKCEGIVRVRIGKNVGTDFVDNAWKLVFDVSNCLRVQKVVNEANGEEFRRRTFSKGIDGWVEIDGFNERMMSSSVIYVVVVFGDVVRVLVGSEVADMDFGAILKGCCEENGLNVPDMWQVVRQKAFL
jgi:hypothetical protein